MHTFVKRIQNWFLQQRNTYIMEINFPSFFSLNDFPLFLPSFILFHVFNFSFATWHEVKSFSFRFSFFFLVVHMLHNIQFSFHFIYFFSSLLICFQLQCTARIHDLYYSEVIKFIEEDRPQVYFPSLSYLSDEEYNQRNGEHFI